MNNSRIKIFLDELFENYEQTPALLEQKEELMIHLTERVQDYMAKGLSYDEAYDASIRGLGDVRALVTGITPAKITSQHSAPHHEETKKGKKKAKKIRKLIRRIAMPLMMMSPFIYILLGLVFGWWAWAWVIIPMAGCMQTGRIRVILVSWSPFIYFLLGWHFGLWAWGWMVIPLAGALMPIGNWRDWS